MTSNLHTTTVQGVTFEVWSDIIKRGTFAKNTETGEVKQIKHSGYISKDLTIRKEIARCYGFESFCK